MVGDNTDYGKIVRKSVSKDIRGVPDTGDSAAKEGYCLLPIKFS
jgi:hypothetical protein